MGRIFISAGQATFNDGRRSPDVTIDSVTAAQEMIQIRDLAVQQLRARNYEAQPVPDDLSHAQAIDWINVRARPEDVALEIHLNAAHSPEMRGAIVFYIASNEQRRFQADQLLQAFLRRLPQAASRGARPDTETGMGRLNFCRQVKIPSLLIEAGFLTNPEDLKLIQTQRQEVALAIAEGLAGWSRNLAPRTATANLSINGIFYDNEALTVDGNPFVPVDRIEQLGIELPLSPEICRISHANIVYVRAIDLKPLNIAVGLEKEPNGQTVTVRSRLVVYPSQIGRIMGRGYTSEVQLIMFLKSYNPDGLARFPTLPRLYIDEATPEQVNHDVAFAQMCAETDFLRFDSIPPEQNNFAHLGDPASSEGASFRDTRIGVRAHVQRLKAYATTEPLVQAPVDPRFDLVRRGIAPTVEQLSGRWSADPDYGHRILAMVRRLYEYAGLL